MYHVSRQHIDHSKLLPTKEGTVDRAAVRWYVVLLQFDSISNIVDKIVVCFVLVRMEYV